MDWARYSLVVGALNLRLYGRKFDSRPPRLVQGWVTVFGPANHLILRLHDTTGCQIGCTTDLTTSWIFVYPIQPVVQPVVKPDWQQVASCKQCFSISPNHLCRLSFLPSAERQMSNARRRARLPPATHRAPHAQNARLPLDTGRGLPLCWGLCDALLLESKGRMVHSTCG